MKPILILIFIGGILYACRNQPKTTVPNYGENQNDGNKYYEFYAKKGC